MLYAIISQYYVVDNVIMTTDLYDFFENKTLKVLP